jgi:hypothetical protein
MATAIVLIKVMSFLLGIRARAAPATRLAPASTPFPEPDASRDFAPEAK